MDDRQRLEQMVTEINQLQKQGETIAQQIEQLNASLADIRSAYDAVDNMAGSVGKETLLPIGAGCFVKAELKSEDVIVGVGSSVAIKKTREETLSTLKEDREEVEKLIKTLTEQLENINKYITEKRPEAEKLMRETGVQQ